MSDRVRVTARYRDSKKGIARVAVGREIRAAVTDVGHRAKDHAELIAPPDSTHYVNAFRLDVEIIPDIPFRVVPNPPMARWAATLVNDEGAIAVEVGTQNTFEHRVLGRTLEWLEATADD